MSLKNSIKSDMSAVRSFCTEQIKNGEKTSAAHWACDNYHCIYAAGKNALAGLKNRSDNLAPCAAACRDVLKDGVLPEHNKLVTRLKNLNLTLYECAALPSLFCAVLLHYIASGIKKLSPGAENGSSEQVINAVKSLMKLKDIDFIKLLPEINAAESILCRDPAGIYENMSDATKSCYRKAVRAAAAEKGISEKDAAEQALKNAENSPDEGLRHVGFYLPLKDRNRARGAVFLVTEAMVSLIISIVFALTQHSVWAGVLLYLPLFAALKPLSDRLSSKIFPVQPLYSMSEDTAIDSENETLIVVSSLLPDARRAEKTADEMAQVFSSNHSGCVRLMLLCDMKNSPTPACPSDETDIAAMKRAVDRLNREFGGGFCFAVRDRVFAPTENEYTGFERKRGALNTLVKELRNEQTQAFSVLHGDIKNLTSVKYMLALDSDSKPAFETVKKLVAIARHPLNAPEYDYSSARVNKGYGIIVPKCETSLSSAGKTFFSEIFTDSFSSFYSAGVAERYMDMFGRTVFTGKGLIDVDAFYAALPDKLENERILSHDILEGFVLRPAFAGECVITDSFPGNERSCEKREHRWIRGDIQNLKYTVKKYTSSPGAYRADCLGRYQLLDNFRRALTPVLSVAAIIAALFMPPVIKYILAVAGVLSVAGEGIFSFILSLLYGGFNSISRLFFSARISSGLKGAVRGLMCIALMPQRAANSLDAVIRASYRSLFSHKKTLEWTTAADSSRAGRANMLYGVIFPIIFSAGIFILDSSALRIIAVLFLLGIPFYLSDGFKKKSRENVRLSALQAQTVTSFAASMWKYYENTVTARENYLPPDNVQETPVYRTARRTSPTNIGMYLVSVLAAADFAFITADEMYERLLRTFLSIEKLVTWNGNLYNWYDTATLRPLKPEYVSTVDCGNFYVSLTALKEGIKEYFPVCPRLRDIYDRIQKITSEENLSLLYSERRQLFHIGYDVSTGEKSDSFYDLYMSEARMTSYYEVAKRNVPVRHWAALDRTLVSSGRFAGAVSWSGTMFEYFMPGLFLKVTDNSFQKEAMSFCLHEQKKYAAENNIPYGVSESCFYAFDDTLNYRYKAHSIRRLALKRSADCEKCISPYSVFLTLPFSTRSALRNLAKLSALHAAGEYGFYEAVDFTPARTSGEDYCIVKAYMAHHVGMSMTACANTLFSDVFVRRFMRDPDMKSAEGLLNEGISTSARVFRSLNIGEREKKSLLPREQSENSCPELFTGCSCFSNGELTLICDKFGRNHLLCAGKSLLNFNNRAAGLCAAVNTGEGIIPLLSDENVNGTLKANYFINNSATSSLKIRNAMIVSSSFPALLCPVKLSDAAGRGSFAEILFYFESSLLGVFAEDSHPSFSDMFIKVKYHMNSACLTFERTDRQSRDKVCIAAGFYDRSVFSFETDREKLLPRDIFRKSVFSERFSELGNTVNGVSPCAGITLGVNVSPGTAVEKVLVLTFGSSAAGAMRVLSELRRENLPDVKKGAKNPLSSDSLTASAAQLLLNRRFFGAPAGDACEKARGMLNSDIGALWQTGISGDLPVISFFPDFEEKSTLETPFLRLHKRLLSAGIPTDLACIFERNPDYALSNEANLRAALKAENMEESVGKRGGVHIFTKNNLSSDSLKAVLSFSSLIFPADTGEKTEVEYKKKAQISMSSPLWADRENCFSGNGYFIGRKPDRPWCLTLSNRSFGTLMSDSSLGYTWALNSRQNKLTPWSDDTSSDFSGEKIYIETDGVIYDAAAGANVFFYDNKAEYYCICGNVRADICTEVPEKGMRKRISVILSNLDGHSRRVSVTYTAAPVLSDSDRFSVFVQTELTPRGAYCRNPLNSGFSGYMKLYNEDENAVCEYERDAGSIAISTDISLTSDKPGRTVFGMCFARFKESCDKLSAAEFISVHPARISLHSDMNSLNKFSSALLLHNVLDARIFARCGFYQCGGAYGFRDQLQDVLSLIDIYPSLAKQLIFRSASVQFPEGDVLHWYHIVRTSRTFYDGVRSRCSDDYLWLAYVTAAYIEKTGDAGILSVKLPYLDGDILGENEKERYSRFSHSDFREELYIHCIKAVKNAMKFGAHSLPLIFGGDWNDSFNEIGAGGQGESVWLGMFLITVLEAFIPVCALAGDDENAGLFAEKADELRAACEQNAYNGEYFIRAFFDDGSVLGDRDSKACRIDLLPQAFSVFARVGTPEQRKSALTAAYENLVDEKNGVVKLFTPPFSDKTPRAGYVNDYPAGVRENGGQYTHSAVWFALALLSEGMETQGRRVLEIINPAHKYESRAGEEIYKTEPYMMCGDVYSAKNMEGRGGWSIYTGSAGWMLYTLRRFFDNEIS